MKAGTPADTAIWLGPPKVRPPSSSMRNSGRTSPYSGRGASSICSSTRPDTPSTRRSTSCGALRPRSWPRWPGAKAIASISRTLPVAVVKVVSIDERARQVAALRGARPRRGDRPVPGVGIEDAGEDGRRVVVGHAQPVDRPVAVDQRGRRAVGQQAVVGDGLKAGRAALGDGGGGLGEDAHGAPVSPRGVELRVTARTTPVTAQRHGAHLHEPAHRRRDRLRRAARRSASCRPCASRRS